MLTNPSYEEIVYAAILPNICWVGYRLTLKRTSRKASVWFDISGISYQEHRCSPASPEHTLPRPPRTTPRRLAYTLVGSSTRG